jgi:zona occludens toxin
MTSLGITSRYRVEVYEGGAQKKSCLVSVSNKKYDKRIFPLYKSYDGCAGKEKTVDGRGNLLNNRWFLGVILVAIIGLVWGSWWFFGYIVRMRNGGGDGKPAAAVTSPHAPDQVSGSSVSAPGLALVAVVPVSSDARLVGVISLRNGESIALVQLADGRIVRQRIDAGVIDGWQSQASYQGKMVGFNFTSKVK